MCTHHCSEVCSAAVMLAIIEFRHLPVISSVNMMQAFTSASAVCLMLTGETRDEENPNELSMQKEKNVLCKQRAHWNNK